MNVKKLNKSKNINLKISTVETLKTQQNRSIKTLSANAIFCSYYQNDYDNSIKYVINEFS